MTLILFLSSLILAYLITGIITLKKHDKNLFGFCELRREIIDFLYKNGDILSRNDYIKTRNLLQILNKTINQFESLQTLIFDYRRFRIFVLDMESVSKKSEKISTDNQQIIEFVKSFLRLYFKAFLSYTPWLRSKLAFKTIYKIGYGVFGKLQVDLSKTQAILKAHEDLLPKKSMSQVAA